MVIVWMIICSYAPPEVNINRLQKIGEQQGSDFMGAGVICDGQSAAKQEVWELTIACLIEEFLRQQLETGGRWNPLIQ